MNKHKTGPAEINPEAVKTVKEVAGYINKELNLDYTHYIKKEDVGALSKAIENSNSTEVLKEYEKTVKETAKGDATCEFYNNVTDNTGQEHNAADTYQKGIGDFFDLPVPDTDEKKPSKLEYIIDGAKTAVPAAIMAALYFTSPVADISPTAATPDTSDDDDDHHSPTDSANYNVQDDISNFMEGLKDKILENSPIPVAAAAEDTPDHPEDSGVLPDLEITNVKIFKTDDEKLRNKYGHDVYRIGVYYKNSGDARAPTDSIRPTLLNFEGRDVAISISYEDSGGFPAGRTYECPMRHFEYKSLEEIEKYVKEVYLNTDPAIDESNISNNYYPISKAVSDFREGKGGVITDPKKAKILYDCYYVSGYPDDGENNIGKYLLGAGLAGLGAGIAHHLKKKTKGPANKARHSKPDKPEYKSNKQKPSSRKDNRYSLGDTIHSVGGNIYSIGKQIRGKMHYMKHPYDSIKQKIGEIYETHRNKGNEGRIKDIEKVKEAVSGLKNKTTRNRTRSAKHKIPKIGRSPKTESPTERTVVLSPKPNLDGMTKISDIRVGLANCEVYFKNKDPVNKVHIVPDFRNMTQEDIDTLKRYFEKENPGGTYEVN